MRCSGELGGVGEGVGGGKKCAQSTMVFEREGKGHKLSMEIGTKWLELVGKERRVGAAQPKEEG